MRISEWSSDVCSSDLAMSPTHASRIWPSFHSSKAKAVEVTLVAGEMLYLPARRSHFVVNLDTSLMVNFWPDITLTGRIQDGVTRPLRPAAPALRAPLGRVPVEVGDSAAADNSTRAVIRRTRPASARSGRGFTADDHGYMQP